METAPAATLIGLVHSWRVKHGFANRPCTRTVASKVQISFLTDRVINILTSYLRKVEKFAFTAWGFFRGLSDKEVATGLWIAK